MVSNTCVEITSATPSTVCLGSGGDVTVKGRGFTNQLVKGQVMCRLKSTDGWFYGEFIFPDSTVNRSDSAVN